MILVKNPAGCNQALSFVTNAKQPTTLVFALNDRYADSTDVSWIWDVDYEKITQMGENLSKIYVTGIRADDMAVRLKYDGIPEDRIEKEPDYDRLFQKLLAEKGNVCILPTYTAMLELRAKLGKLTDIKDFWE
jgi:UDP-N-acetylmuramyl tripeptide synthase